MQKKIHVSNKVNLSSNINEGIKSILFFKRKHFTRTKSTKTTNSIKRKLATLTKMFFIHIKSTKSTKSTKRQTHDFLLLRRFYAHKNCFTHKKAQKAQKRK